MKACPRWSILCHRYRKICTSCVALAFPASHDACTLDGLSSESVIRPAYCAHTVKQSFTNLANMTSALRSAAELVPRYATPILHERTACHARKASAELRQSMLCSHCRLATRPCICA